MVNEYKIRLLEEKVGINFNKMYDEIYPIMFHKLKQFVSNEGEDEQIVKDVISEATIVSIDKVHQFDPSKGTYGVWLYSIAKNIMLQQKKNNKRIFRIIDEDGGKDEDSKNEAYSVSMKDISKLSDDVNDINKEEMDMLNSKIIKASILKDYIDRISPENSRAVYMKDFEGMTYKEISEELNVNENTVKSRVKLGRVELIELTKELMDEIDLATLEL